MKIIAHLLLLSSFIFFGIEVEAGEKEVLVYYSNESRYDGESLENFKTIKSWLLNLNTEKSLKMASLIERDRENHPAIMKKQIEDIQVGVGGSERFKEVGVVLASNQLASEGKILVKRIGRTIFEVVSVDFFDGDNFAARSAPLVQKDNLKLVLEKSRNIFSSEMYQARYSIILKSHGTAKYGMVSRISIDAKELGVEEFNKIISGESKRMIKKIGITKPEILTIVEDTLTDRFGSVSLLFLKSCESDISAGLSEFNRNLTIDRIYMTTDKTPIELLNYSDVLGTWDTTRSLSLYLGEYIVQVGGNNVAEMRKTYLASVLNLLERIDFWVYPTFLIFLILVIFLNLYGQKIPNRIRKYSAMQLMSPEVDKK